MGRSRLFNSIVSKIFSDNESVSKDRLRSYFGAREYINPYDYGAKGDGKSDDTTAFETAIKEAGGSSAIMIPPGHFIISRPLFVTQSAVRIFGAGRFATILQYSGDGALFVVGASNEDQYLSAGTFEEFTVIGNNSNKGIELGNTSKYRVANINIQDCSVGIHLRGRELTSLSDLSINAALPIVISKNSSSHPKFLGIDCDHLRATNLLLICTSPTGICVLVKDRVYLSNMTFDGYQSWNLGSYGFHFANQNGVQASHNVRFENVRWEQAQSNGYQFFINSKTAQMQGFMFVNCGGGASSFYFRHMINPTIIGHTHRGMQGTYTINADGTVSDLLIQNCFWQVGSAAYLVGLNMRWADLYSNPAVPLPVNGSYTNTPIRRV